jgi:hypothetical protein
VPDRPVRRRPTRRTRASVPRGAPVRRPAAGPERAAAGPRGSARRRCSRRRSGRAGRADRCSQVRCQPVDADEPGPGVVSAVQRELHGLAERGRCTRPRAGQSVEQFETATVGRIRARLAALRHEGGAGCRPNVQPDSQTPALPDARRSTGRTPRPSDLAAADRLTPGPCPRTSRLCGQPPELQWEVPWRRPLARAGCPSLLPAVSVSVRNRGDVWCRGSRLPLAVRLGR